MYRYDIPIDMIAAGDGFTLAANSEKGLVYFWGKFRAS